LPANLSKILISQSSVGRQQALENLHRKLLSATYFEAGDERNVQLSYIIDYVRKRGDDALQEFTEKFDGVSLKP
jgi:histidinol dehydrogenase